MQLRRLSFLLASMCFPVFANAQIVSPVGFASVESGSNNTYPFLGTEHSYQQIHGDIRGRPQSISGLAFRRDGTSTSAYPARTATIDMWMGDTDLATITNTFATNFMGPATHVIAARAVNLPDHSALPITLPAPFTVVLNLDAPYAHAGTLDLLWELRMTANTLTSNYPMDYATGADQLTTSGTARQSGTGCTTAAGEMSLRWVGSTTSTLHTIRWRVTDGPVSAQTSLLVGNQVTIPFPGLCTAIQTDGAFFTLGGTTNAAGVYLSPLITVPYNAAFVGIPLGAQAASLDATQPGLPLALSNGLWSRITGTVAGPILCARIFATNNATALTGTIGNNSALVTSIR